VRLRELDGGKACVVFGDTLPCWLPVLPELGLGAVMVLLRSDKMLGAVEAIVDDECIIVVGPDWSVFGTRVPNFNTQEVVGLVDGRITTEVASLATAMSLHAVTTTASARRNLPGWTSKKVLVDHARVGGITTVQPRIQRYN
jgi:hypothetical protein